MPDVKQANVGWVYNNTTIVDSQLSKQNPQCGEPFGSLAAMGEGRWLPRHHCYY